MAKTATPVNKESLVAAINEAEKNGPLKNQSVLWKEAAKLYNEVFKDDIFKAISHSVVMLRARDWDVEIKTPAGRRGGPLTDEHKAAMAAGRGSRTSRSEKFASNDSVQEAFAAMQQMLETNDASRFSSLVDKIKKGSMRAAVQLNCLQCCAFQTKEVRLCGCQECPLWAFRPYQGQEHDADIADEPDALTPAETAEAA